MARRPEDPRPEETRTQPRRGYDEPRGNGGRTDTGRHAASDTRTRDTDVRERREPDQLGYGNGPAIAALVVGMISVTLSFLIFPAIAAVLLGIAAIILGVIGMNNANRLNGLHKGISITGIVTGALAVILSGAVLIVGAQFLDDIQENVQVEELQDALNIE